MGKRVGPQSPLRLVACLVISRAPTSMPTIHQPPESPFAGLLKPLKLPRGTRVLVARYLASHWRTVSPYQRRERGDMFSLRRE